VRRADALKAQLDPGVALIVMDDPAAGADRERPVRIILTSAQAAEVVRRLQAVVD
jgi:hypothetical protein